MAPGRPWVVVDTETSGLDPERHELTELAAVVVSPDLREERVVRWARADGPDALGAACRELAPAVEAGVVVAHHLRFDLEFLQRLAPGVAGVLAEPARWLCTLHANGSRRSLDALADAFDVPIVDRHTALGDARALSVVLSRAITEADGHGMSTVGGIVVRMALRQGRTPAAVGPSAVGWSAVLGAIDHVVPLPVVTREHRAAVATALDAIGGAADGPGDPAAIQRVIDELRGAGVSALACVWILEEHGILVGGSHGDQPAA